MKKRSTRPDRSPISPARNASRRKALKALAAAGGVALASKWSTPVIETAVLPAHAQATGGFDGDFAGTLATVVTRNWLDMLVPKATAGIIICGSDNGAPICIQIVAGAVSVQVSTSGGVLVGGGSLIGSSFNISFGGDGSVNGTLNGAQDQITGQVSLNCADLQADAGSVFTGERVQVASLMLAGTVGSTVFYDFTADLGAICQIGTD